VASQESISAQRGREQQQLAEVEELKRELLSTEQAERERLLALSALVEQVEHARLREHEQREEIASMQAAAQQVGSYPYCAPVPPTPRVHNAAALVRSRIRAGSVKCAGFSFPFALQGWA
jgi:hypothetical protein